MTKIIIALIIIGAIGFGGYVMRERQTAALVVKEQSVSTTSDKKVPFATLIAGGDSYRCTVYQSMSDMENSGIVYASNGNLRGEFTVIAEGRTIKSWIIVRDGFMYSWNSAMPTGFKMTNKISPTASAEVSGTYRWNAEHIGDYECQPWVAEASTFAIPTDITFTTIGQ